jgi:hypothetical protein
VETFERCGKMKRHEKFDRDEATTTIAIAIAIAIAKHNLEESHHKSYSILSTFTIFFFFSPLIDKQKVQRKTKTRWRQYKIYQHINNRSL